MMPQDFFVFRDHLALFKKMDSQQAFWEKRWAAHDLETELERFKSGHLDEFEDVFSKFLPTDSRILEAGCGRGQVVRALQSRGYSVEGIDYAERTIARIKEVAPDLQVRLGDVYELPYASGSFGAYLSLGIFEHNLLGPMPGLREARRVLADGGIGLISVPFLNRARRSWKRGVPVAGSELIDGGLEFYQFYFTRQEFESQLREAGFTVVEVLPYALYAGLTRDWQLGRWLHQRSFFFWGVQRRVTRWCRSTNRLNLGLRWSFAHMLMFVARAT